MTEKIRVLIVDDVSEVREHLSRLLGLEPDIEVVGQAGSGAEGLAGAMRLQPDIVLMDVNMPDGDGISTTRLLADQVPAAAVIMMSVQGEADYLRQAMLAGAREFLVKPFSIDELVGAIHQVNQREREKRSRTIVPTPAAAAALREQAEPGKLIAVFSPKGGVGKTTIAVNMAVALSEQAKAHKEPVPGPRVLLMDGSFQAGDVSVLLNLSPGMCSIDHMYDDTLGRLNVDLLDGAVSHFSAHLDALLAPPSPEYAEHISASSIRLVIEALRRRYDFIVVDLPTHFSEPTLAVLDLADLIITILTTEITALINVKHFLSLAHQLGYDKNLQIVLNRADANLGIKLDDVERSLGRKINHTIVSDGRVVVPALNGGKPFVTEKRDAPVSHDVVRLAKNLLPQDDKTKSGRRGLFGRR